MNALTFGETPHPGDAAGDHGMPFAAAPDLADQEPPDGLLFAVLAFPELGEWLPVLRRLNLFPGDAAIFASRARANGTEFSTELLASGCVPEADFTQALAAELGIGSLATVQADRLIVGEQAASFLRNESWRIPFRFADGDGLTTILLSPTGGVRLAQLRGCMANRRGLRSRLKLAGPTALRQALIAHARPLLAPASIRHLEDSNPAMSARVVVRGWQGIAAGLLGMGLLWAFCTVPGMAWFALHCFFSIFFLSCVVLRIATLATIAGPPRRPAVPGTAGNLPVYSVLVALYREAEVVPELVASLRRLEWPPSKLDIKLVCEADDLTTLSTLRSIGLPPHMEVIEVPAVGPRTKPKALAYALPLAKGEFVALYDAEDHPHPRQLLDAWQTFKTSPPELACVQAPLEIANSRASIVARMFAFEYAALFRGMLPWLSRCRLLFPLGGTSNHFRRAALDEVGNWDAFNVTEDADLGVRLARFGYRTQTITCPTFETSPESFATWLPQRTRWLKGWMQTWLVHMRNPILLLREIGLGSFLIVQILFAGMVLSALAHPFLVVTGLVLAVELALDRPTTHWKTTLFTIDFINVACGYLSFLMLGWKVSTLRERLGFWKVVLFTPVYWMMISIAAWRALWQLCWKPHLWEKTPHRPLRGARPGRLQILPAGGRVAASPATVSVRYR
jgi:cellulose synthase/poly-beta-1,6-N-acetylglucosamine synthase-like glycosyltransferase